jgi:hypothetical protein
MWRCDGWAQRRASMAGNVLPLRVMALVTTLEANATLAVWVRVRQGLDCAG